MMLKFVIADLSTQLQTPVRNVYTLSGMKLSTVADVFDGSGEYYVETGEWHPKRPQQAIAPLSKSAGCLPAVQQRPTDALLHTNVRKRKSKKSRTSVFVNYTISARREGKLADVRLRCQIRPSGINLHASFCAAAQRNLLLGPRGTSCFCRMRSLSAWKSTLRLLAAASEH